MKHSLATGGGGQEQRVENGAGKGEHRLADEGDHRTAGSEGEHRRTICKGNHLTPNETLTFEVRVKRFHEVPRRAYVLGVCAVILRNPPG